MSESILSIHINTNLPPSSGSEGNKDSEVEIKLDEFPEGGTVAWCAVIGGALVQVCGFGYISSFGVYQDFYMQHYLSDESASAISWIGSINAFLTSAFGLVAGPLYDRGRFYHMMICGSLLQSFSLFMLSLTKPGQYYQILLLQGFCLGIAQGALYVPSIAVISHHFRHRRALAMSFVASGSSLGAIIHPIMLNNLFNRGIGFTNGVRISAASISTLLLISCLITRTRLQLFKRPANYLSVGNGIIHDEPFLLMCFGLLCFNIAIFFPLLYLQLDSVKHGNSESFSFYSLVLFNGGSFTGRLTGGFIATYIGVSMSMIIGTGVCGILIIGMIGLNRIPSIVVLGTTFGYFFGVYAASLPPLMVLLTRDHSELGARMGIAMTVLGIGNLIGGPVAGALLTSHFKWWQPALFAGLMALVGSASFVMMQFALVRRRKLEQDQDRGKLECGSVAARASESL